MIDTPELRPPSLEAQAQRWDDAALAAACLAIGGQQIGGVRLRARPGPVRDLWLQQARGLLPAQTPWRKLPLHCSDARLLGGLDLSATLRHGAPVAERGLLLESDGGVVLLAMAERASANAVAALCSLLDHPVHRIEREGIAGEHACELSVVALDEGVDDEALDPGLTERLALSLDLDCIAISAVDDFPWSAEAIREARDKLADVRLKDPELEALCKASLALGIASPRVPLLAARIARCLAVLAGEETVGPQQLEQVLRLVLLPRATQLPAPPQEEQDELDEADSPQDAEPSDTTEQPPEPPPPRDSQDDSADAEAEAPPQPQALDDEKLLEAARAVLPENLLARLLAGKSRNRRSGAQGKSGARQRHLLRGRPMGSIAGDPRSGARLDLMATLRTAAPWQRLRGASAGGAAVNVSADDFRVVRFRQRAQSVTVFVVDASGSSALYRLAEAKGAIELLLADCYVRRDEVALIAFRGNRAELLLPPTRSLVRAKRSLSALPGGGGTPLAAALDATADLLEQLERRGATPAYVMLTDGRANVCRDGGTGRERATEDALQAAAGLRLRSSARGMVIDTSPRPHRSASALAGALDALYLPLPNADAAQLQAVVRQVAA